MYNYYNNTGGNIKYSMYNEYLSLGDVYTYISTYIIYIASLE